MGNIYVIQQKHTEFILVEVRKILYCFRMKDRQIILLMITEQRNVYMIDEAETEIKPFAFENSDMKGLFIPDNVESIGTGAFDGCTEMETISAMSELLEKVGFEIFNDTNINQQALADSIAEIKEGQDIIEDISDEDNSTEDIEEL